MRSPRLGYVWAEVRTSVQGDCQSCFGACETAVGLERDGVSTAKMAKVWSAYPTINSQMARVRSDSPRVYELAASSLCCSIARLDLAVLCPTPDFVPSGSIP